MSKPRLFEAVLVILLLIMCVIMLQVVTTGKGDVHDAWNLTSAGPVSNILVGDDGTLYVISGQNSNCISAIDPAGNTRWNLVLPDNWQPANRFYMDYIGRIEYGGNYVYDNIAEQQYALDDGRLYLYVGEINTTGWDYNARHIAFFTAGSSGFTRNLVALSAQGKILWKKPISEVSRDSLSCSIYAANSRVYVKDNHSVTVVDDDGKILYRVADVSGEPTVDSENNLYVVRCTVSDYRYVYREDGIVECYYPDGTLRGFQEAAVLNMSGEEHIYGQTGIVECYGPDGMLRWRTDLGENVRHFAPKRFIGFNTDLYYCNGTLIVPGEETIYYLDSAGNITRTKNCTGLNYWLFQPSPVDSQGNLYLLLETSPPFLDVVSPDGTDHLRDIRDAEDFTASFRGTGDGSVYYSTYFPDCGSYENFTAASLMAAQITARDELHNQTLWNYTLLPAGSEQVIPGDTLESLTLCMGSISRLNLTSSGGTATLYTDYYRGNRDHGALVFTDRGNHYWGMQVAPGKDAVFINYYTLALPGEASGNQSTAIYSNYLYALSNNGTLLWQKPLLSPVTSMAVNNSTLYYGTRDGRLFAENTGLLAGGLTLAAALYLFFRFFLAGTVARAKTRLHKNENRNNIVDYVEAHPGSTLRDISRGLTLNLGTVRYHMLVLELNHRLSALQADDKHVRYFPASGRYSREDRLVISLAKREGMRKVLALLSEKQGLSNTDLSRELNMKESAVSRYMKVLTDRGVVDRSEAPGGSLSYSINGNVADSVDRAIKRE